MTPHSVHHGQAEQLRGMRQAVLDDAFHATPNRFKGRRPEPQAAYRCLDQPTATTGDHQANITTALRSKFVANGGAKSLTCSGGAAPHHR